MRVLRFFPTVNASRAWLILPAVIAAGLAVAEEPAAPPDAAQISGWIEQLAAE